MSKISALIADDVPEMRQLLRMILRDLGCDVFLVDDGVHVMNAIDIHKPDIIFLDLDMPKMSGMEVLKQLEKLATPPYTVIITANTSEESRNLALDLGANGHINKPYSAQKISDVIQSFCTYREAPKICTALIADDEELMRKLLKNMLEKQSCRVSYSVENGAEVLACLKNNPLPDIVLLDIDMPVLDGLSVLRQIREMKLDVFCAMVSAHSTFENVKNAMGQGADGFVVKPYTDEKLRQLLGKYYSMKKIKTVSS